jgi:hypothetical protein
MKKLIFIFILVLNTVTAFADDTFYCASMPSDIARECIGLPRQVNTNVIYEINKLQSPYLQKVAIDAAGFNWANITDSDIRSCVNTTQPMECLYSLRNKKNDFFK